MCAGDWVQITTPETVSTGQGCAESAALAGNGRQPVSRTGRFLHCATGPHGRSSHAPPQFAHARVRRITGSGSGLGFDLKHQSRDRETRDPEQGHWR